jgi:hypothetical protein
VLAWGEQILTMAVLSIILFAPLGAILIQSLGPVLLAAGNAESVGDAESGGPHDDSDKLPAKKEVKH